MSRTKLPDHKMNRDETTYPLRILFALQRKLIYGGTVDRAEVRRRRAANKRARRSRRANRVRGV